MMHVPPISSRLPLLASVLVAVLAAGSCHSERPAAPDIPSTAPAGAQANAHATAQSGGNQPPTAVFKTTPLANDESVITGGSSLEVTFNLCLSSDPDEGDELRYWFDYDGDGKQDEWGHCRATHLYKVGEFESACVFSKACVSDRQPDHAVCHTYEVCTFGKPRPGASPSPSTSPGPSPSPTPTPTPSPDLTDQHEDGDFAAPSSKDIWSFTAAAGTDVTIRLDTVSETSAYVMGVCISTSTRRLDCIKPVSKGRVDCSFGNELVRCPVKSYVLPQNGGLYHVLVSGFRPRAEQDGKYVVEMTAHPGTGPLGLEADNVAYETID
jgi:hypothetical protein